MEEKGLTLMFLVHTTSTLVYPFYQDCELQWFKFTYEAFLVSLKELLRKMFPNLGSGLQYKIHTPLKWTTEIDQV